MTIQECFNKFVNYQMVLGHTYKTIQSYKSHVIQFINFMDNCEISKINYNDYENYIIFLRTNKNIKSVSIHSYATSLKAFLNWSYKEKYLLEDIASKIKLPKYQKNSIHILSSSEITDILGYYSNNSFIGARNNLILILFLDAGLRLNEVVNLNIIDFRIDERLININGKGQKQRYVPMTDSIYEAFKNYMSFFDNKLAPLSQMFVDNNGFAINQECIKSFFRRLRNNLKIPKLHPHLLRHTFATTFLLNGGDPLSLQLILGHTNLTMTQKYVHFAAEIRLVEQMQYSPLSHIKK